MGETTHIGSLDGEVMSQVAGDREVNGVGIGSLEGAIDAEGAAIGATLRTAGEGLGEGAWRRRRKEYVTGEVSGGNCVQAGDAGSVGQRGLAVGAGEEG